MSSKFGQSRTQTTELNLHRYIMGKAVSPCFSAVCYRILFTLAGKDEIHKSLSEFEIWPHMTTDYRVSCPSASKNQCQLKAYNASTFSRLFRIQS